MFEGLEGWDGKEEATGRKQGEVGRELGRGHGKRKEGKDGAWKSTVDSGDRKVGRGDKEKVGMKGGKAAVGEDKSPRETWLIPTAVFLAACVQMALIAGWVWCPGLDLISAEFMMCGFWADYLPPRMSRFLYPGMHWRGRFVPYCYATVKLKCYGGEGSYTESSHPSHLNATMAGPLRTGCGGSTDGF